MAKLKKWEILAQEHDDRNDNYTSIPDGLAEAFPWVETERLKWLSRHFRLLVKASLKIVDGKVRPRALCQESYFNHRQALEVKLQRYLVNEVNQLIARLRKGDLVVDPHQDKADPVDEFGNAYRELFPCPLSELPTGTPYLLKGVVFFKEECTPE